MSPTLPVELIRIIITLALDSLAKPDSLQARYDLLLLLALVSLTFRDIAQPLLVARAWLRSPKATRSFLRAIAKERFRVSAHVVELRFDRPEPCDDTDRRLALGYFRTARSIMRKCQGVRKVVLQGDTIDARGLSLLQRECARATASTSELS